MERSRNVATSAISRSSNWAAIRRLNSQRGKPASSKCLSAHTPSRCYSAESSSNVSPADQPPSKSGGRGLSADITRYDGFLRLTFAKQPGKRYPSQRSVLKKSQSVYRQFDKNAKVTDVADLPVRERLRIYERDVLEKGREMPVAWVNDVSGSDGSKLSTQNDTLRAAPGNVDEALSLPGLEADDLAEFGDHRTRLLPGDLVEFRSNGKRVELAIYVRDLQRQSQFYTISGRWLHRSSKTAYFFVPGFVSKEEVEALHPYLPASDVPEAQQDKLQKLENALPRQIGRNLISKMRKFELKADALYREHSKSLDNAYAELSGKFDARYMDLKDIQSRLLPRPHVSGRYANEKPEDKHVSRYAVYRALLNMDAGFRIYAGGIDRRSVEFEILPRRVMETITLTTNIVRTWQRQKPSDRLESSLSKFIKRAQVAIDRSRSCRPHTEYGWIGPANREDGASTKVLDENHFDKRDLVFIRFLKAWAAWDSFDPKSYIAATGSSILRAIGRYESHIDLDQATAWQFLQEIGAVKPWETPTPFRLRLEGYRYSDSFLQNVTTGNAVPADRSLEEGNTLLKSTDRMEGLRQEWNGVRAYCIDDPSAYEIDDAVSITKTADEGIYWIHVHVADPASIVKPDGLIMKRAEKMVSNTYLPDRVVTMLPDSIVREKLSLAPGRPTLTFSARVNMKGEMLSHKITPGTIKDVVYLSPQTLSAVFGGEESKSEHVFTVGDQSSQKPAVSGAPRYMTPLSELSQEDRDNLKLMIDIGAARRNLSKLRGGVSMHSDSVNVSVKMDTELAQDGRRDLLSSAHYNQDPIISLDVKPPVAKGDIAPLMILAGEVCAKWCKKRHIPVIARTTENLPVEQLAASEALFHNEIKPYYLRGEDPPMELTLRYLRSCGSVESRPQVHPHALLGVEGFVRCTSPLRRYSDLLTHFQIEAALLYESSTLVGPPRKSAFYQTLPFSLESIQAYVHKHDQRELLMKRASTRANREWALQALLRAWKFGEGDKLPKVFTFRVTAVQGLNLQGQVKELGMFAWMKVPEFVEDLDSVQVDDVFEAKIESVMPYYAILNMEGTKKLDAEAYLKDWGNVKYF